MNTDHIYRENKILELAILSVIGDREEQQDSFGYEIKENDCIVSVCDGMGGHKGGQKASSTAVSFIVDTYKKTYPQDNMVAFLNDVTVEADKRVAELKEIDGNSLNAGSTMVTIYIRGDELYWSSVGDSRLYIMREEELVQVTLDHNYHEYLKEQFANGQITKEVFEKEDRRGEALINFLGVGGLQIIDHNEDPLKLFSGDKLIITTDGLYKVIDDETICSLVSNFGNIEEALNVLEVKTSKTAEKKSVVRDNMTVALIKIK